MMTVAKFAVCLVALLCCQSTVAAKRPKTIEGVWSESYKNSTWNAYCILGMEGSVFSCNLIIKKWSKGPITSEASVAQNNVITGYRTAMMPLTYVAYWATTNFSNTFEVASNGKTMEEKLGMASLGTWTRESYGV